MYSRADLLQHLRTDTRVLKDPLVAEAFTEVDRKDFVPEDYADEAYEDYALPIGFDQTISQPTTVAFMLEQLHLEKGLKVLDVGSGSGWTSCLLAAIVGEEGDVYAVERVEELLHMGQQNAAQYNFENLAFFPSDDALGLPQNGPFDRILVSAAATEDVPQALVDQLAKGGRLVIPVDGDLVVVLKDSKGVVTKKAHGGFSFVPLVE